MDSQGEMLIEQRCRAHDHAGANEIKRALERISADEKDRENDQRQHATAAQDPIVDLQHVKRASEHQQVDDTRKERDAAKCAPAIAQGRCDVRMNGGAGWQHQLFPPIFV